MASLQGLPPLPKSLSGLMNFSSAQWKEMERLHAMRTMIQQDLSSVQRGPAPQSEAPEPTQADCTDGLSRSGRLDRQLALLRKEMVGLRQLDMSLLCQLWSLNESIHEYKQLMQDRMSLTLSPIHASSPGWDNGMDSPSSEGDANNKSYDENNSESLECIEPNRNVPSKKLSSVDSTSHSSLEFGDI